jgi:hypothetical protein
MDISDRIESEVPGVAIPAHLVFAFEEWIAQQIRAACDRHDSPENQGSVIEAVHVRDAFVAGSLTPRQTAELADGAASWLAPQWPTSTGEADEVERLVAATRELLELRDHATALASNSDNISRVVTVGPGLREILRSQSLLVLEFDHHRFEDVCDLGPAALLGAASIFRDALAVLDTIGWLATEQTATVEVAITPGHLAQLQRLRSDVAMRILDRLDSREDLAESDDLAEADEAIAADRLTAHGLLQLLQSCKPEA